jgi:hypothetical protein
MLIQLAKWLARAPMSEADLLKVSQSLIANPPLPDDMRSVLTARKYTDGQSLLDGCWSEMRIYVEHIAAEKTWSLQRQRLIHFRVAAASWSPCIELLASSPRIAVEGLC